jgi:hypothetical protein
MQETSVVTTDPAADSSGNGNTGAYIFPTPGSITDSAGITTELNPGKQFTPGDGYVDVPAAIGGSASAFSIEFLLKPDSNTFNPGLRAIFASDDFNGGAVHLNLVGTKIELAVSGNFYGPVSYPSTELAASAPVDEWTHVVATFAISGADHTIKFYANGVLLNGPSGVTGTGSTLADLSLAASIGQWSGDRFLSGALDEFAIYDFALSDAQVAAHFAAIPEPSSLALLAFGMISMFLFRRNKK